MDNEVVFVLIIVALVFVVARTLYSRRTKRRLIGDHQVARQQTPGAAGPSERDHDHGDHAPHDRGTRAGA